MKVILELDLAQKDEPLYVARSADLLEKMAEALRNEANGGPVVSTLGAACLYVNDCNDTLRILDIHG